MEININPEEIDKFVKDKILESTIGKNISAAIDKSIKELFDGYRNPINDIVKKHLEEMIKEYMNKDDIKPLILNAVSKAITPEAIETIITYGVYELKKRYENK